METIDWTEARQWAAAGLEGKIVRRLVRVTGVHLVYTVCMCVLYVFLYVCLYSVEVQYKVVHNHRSISIMNTTYRWQSEGPRFDSEAIGDSARPRTGTGRDSNAAVANTEPAST